jgi:UDP-glucose 4-epimerase
MASRKKNSSSTPKKSDAPKKSGVRKKSAARTRKSKSRGVSQQGAVVITGISGTMGRLLAKTLHRDHKVVGIDRRPFPEAPRDIELNRIDIRSRRCEDVFRTHKVDVVIHLNIMHDPRRSAEERHTFNVIGTQQLLEYCVRYDVPKLIVLSTANVYGPHPRNMRYLSEDAPLMAGATDMGMRDLIELDMLCCSFFWQHPEVETVVLRPVHILGTVQNAASNYLRLPRIPKLLGFDPVLQVVHEEDVVRALIKTLQPGAWGVFNVTGPPAVPLSAILDELGKPILPVPHLLFEPMVKHLYRAGVWGFPPPELDHIKYGCMVDSQRIRQELGFEHKYSLHDIMRMFRSEQEEAEVM